MISIRVAKQRCFSVVHDVIEELAKHSNETASIYILKRTQIAAAYERSTNAANKTF